MTVATSALTRAMRQALATAPVDQGLAGLFHGQTLNALERHGLARREQHGDEAEWYLTADGITLRQVLRDRVDERLAAHGFRPTRVQSLYSSPAEGDLLVTRAGAMRRTGVKW